MHFEDIVGTVGHSPTTEGLAKSVLYVGEVTLEPGPAAEKEISAVKNQSLSSCATYEKEVQDYLRCQKRILSTCVVKVKLNVVDARLCDAW